MPCQYVILFPMLLSRLLDLHQMIVMKIEQSQSKLCEIIDLM